MDNENKTPDGVEIKEILGEVKTQPKLSRRFGRLKRKLLARHVWFLRVGLAGLFAIALLLIISLVRLVFANTPLGFYASIANNFLFTPQKNIEIFNDRTNILVLGKAGDGHTAPELTDTIMLVSISHKGDGITLISVPRDIWVEGLRAKINSAFYWGNKKRDGGGIILARSLVDEVLGVPIQYTIVIDFSGFVKIINVMGGVEIEVERGFADTEFPIPGKENDECDGDLEFKCRYETVVFKEGKQIMNGETALKFVRSRHSDDKLEGTDLARAERQQQVLSAIKKRITASDILLSPNKLNELWDTWQEITETDMTPQNMAILARRALQSKDNISSSTVPEELLENPAYSKEYDNLYVFIPKGGSWEEVHKWAAKLLGI